MQAIYCIYCTAMIAIVMCRVPNYTDIKELTGLQLTISTTGLALFLLLSFRTNSCYERWWEGRKLWEGTLEPPSLKWSQILHVYVCSMFILILIHQSG